MGKSQRLILKRGVYLQTSVITMSSIACFVNIIISHAIKCRNQPLASHIRFAPPILGVRPFDRVKCSVYLDQIGVTSMRLTSPQRSKACITRARVATTTYLP